MTPETFRPARFSRNDLTANEMPLSGKMTGEKGVGQARCYYYVPKTSPCREFDRLGRNWNFGFCFENLALFDRSCPFTKNERISNRKSESELSILSNEKVS